MKNLLLVALSLLLLPAAAPAQKPGTLAKDDPAAPGRPSLKRRDPVPDAGPAAQPPAGGLDQRLADLTLQISREMSDNQKRTIAVVEFVDLKGRVTDFGRFLAEELITRLYQTRKFKVVERQLLNKVITEQKLSLTGVIDQKSAQQLGRLLGVEAVASGTVTDMGRSLRVNARLIDTSTAEVFAVASAEIAKDESVTRLMEEKEPTPDGNSAKSPQAVRKAQKASSQFVTFELKQCRRSGSSVICDFLLTNDDKDRGLSLYWRGTEMYDDTGNSYNASHVEFGNATRHVTMMEGWLVSGTLVSGIATKGRVQFDKVAPQAQKISLLQIVGGSEGGEIKIQFRNFAFSE